MEIIPAIDIIDGKCVRLSQGDFEQKKIYNNNPVEVAKQFEDAGLKRLHLVDLDGVKTGAVKNWKMLEAIARETNLVIDFGGGIKTTKDVEIIFSAGAAYAAIGTVAIKNKNTLQEWLQQFGAERFLLGADVKNEKIAIAGWKEETTVTVYDFIAGWQQQRVKQFFCTDISKDGMMQGPAIDLYKKILQRFPSVELIASGGVTNENDLKELEQAGCSGAIIGKTIYEGSLSLNQLKKYL
ncbi:MAG: 1-(5-phosphoribosyl)-5-[(5-phosphoribosylamino)methylideneamino]imidazole-4-carboxamide isomerase [Chitinophagaceae bacterium]